MTKKFQGEAVPGEWQAEQRDEDPASNRSRPDEVNYKCHQQESPLHVKFYLQDTERRELIRDISDSACLLYEYYLRCVGRAHTRTPEVLDDAAVAYHFGWSVRKVANWRRRLEQEGWFRRVGLRFSDGRTGVTYYVGKQAVQASMGGVGP